MNNRQRRVIALGTMALAVHTVFFTPYNVREIKPDGYVTVTHMWLERRSLWRAMKTDPERNTISGSKVTVGPSLAFHPTRLLMEWAVILLVTTGATLAVGGRRR